MKQHLTLSVLACGMILATAAHALPSAEQKCQAARNVIAGTYDYCQQRAVSTFQINSTTIKYEAIASKCRVKYTGWWPKYQVKSAFKTSLTCIKPRFEVIDAGTVTDNLTGLQWEMKTTDGTVHDVSNLYTWSIDMLGGAADGTAFTDFLRNLNSDPCFANACDWRLPTRDEIQTLLVDPYTGATCATSGCIDPIFGPTATGSNAYYWTGTTDSTSLGTAWRVSFDNGMVLPLYPKGNARFVRAVRGSGL